jgi:hypothetical protein
MQLKFGTAIVLTVIMVLMLPSIPLISDEEDTKVDAAMSTTADAAGYTWVNSRDPSPKLTYEWIEISTTGTPQKANFRYPYSYYDAYMYQGTPAISLPFSFPFYGANFNQIYIWPQGVLTFQDTSNGYLYYAQSQFPSTYYDYYMPRNCISPYYHYYGGVQISGDSNVFTGTGVNETGVKYWICEWKDVCGYYFLYNYGTGYYTIISGDNKITFEAVLYEDGNIRFNYQDVSIGTIQYKYSSYTYTTDLSSYSDGGSYVLVGCQDSTGTVGLTYSYNSRGSVKSGESVVIKQFKTEIRDVQISKGYGADEKVHPAMNGLGVNTAIDATLFSEKGVSYLTQYDITIGADEKIVIRYDFTKGKFLKLNDPGRLLVLDEMKSYIELDPVNPLYIMKVHVEFDFNLWWENYDPIDLNFNLRGNAVAASKYNLKGAFKVESRISLVGAMTVDDSRGITVSNGGWVAGNEVLHFSGVHREYFGLGPELVPPDFIKAGVIDQAGVKYFGNVPDLDLNVIVDAVFPQMSFKLIMDNVTAKHDLTPLEMKAEFFVRIDSDKPGIPGDLKIFADQLTDNAQDYDNDPEVYLTWTDAVDASSGVAYYHISVNKDQRHASAKDVFTAPKGTNAWVMKNLPKGINKIYMWSEDNVGNDGGDVFTTIRIDTDDPVTFQDYYPNTGVWITNRNPSCSIRINDIITGVDPRTIEYEFTTKGEADLTGSWQSIQESYAPDNSLYIVVTGWFQSGKLNYMRFRAKDVAGNGPFVSENYNVWVDAEAPSFSLKSPLESDYSLNPVQQVRIDVKDLDSGIDFSSIEYRVSTQGKTRFGPWMPYKDASGSPSQVTMLLREEFERGDMNFVQVRAKDIVGNQRASNLFNIKISSYPEVVIASPSPDEVYFDKDMIVFDATGSYDPDGQNQVKITWYRNSDDGLVTFLDSGYQAFDDFEAGAYRITVEVKSGDLVSTESFTLRVNPRPPEVPVEDTDLDGMLDWWELQEGTDRFIKDPDKDPDNDGFANILEYQNGTRPLDPRSHPAVIDPEAKKGDYTLFEGGMWLLLVALIIIVLAVIAAVTVARAKKEKAEKRIKAVRNMRKIMPSVSWDHITAASYMAAASSSGMMPTVPSGPALPGAAQTIPPDQTLPPAPDHIVAQAQPVQPQQTQ